MPPVFSQPGSVLLGGNPSQRPPGMMGAFPQFAQYPGSPATFPLVGYQGASGAPPPPHVETPEEMSARIAAEERDRLRATNGSPSDPDMHEPVSVEPTVGNIMGAIGNMVAIGTLGPLGIANLAYQVATNSKGPQTVGKTVSDILGLDKDKGSFIDLGNYQSPLGANPVDPATPSFDYDPGLGVNLGLEVGGILDNAVASLGPNALGTTPSPSVVETTPIDAFDVHNLDAMNSLADKDNVASTLGATPGDEEGAGADAPSGSYDSAADAAASDVSDASANAADAGGMGGNDASNSGEGSVYRTGGQIPADGDGSLEEKPIVAHEGEIVMNPEAVAMIGADKLLAMNEAALRGGLLQSDEGMPLTRNPAPDTQQDLAPRLRGSVLLGNEESAPLDLNELAIQSALLGGKQKPQRPMMMGG